MLPATSFLPYNHVRNGSALAPYRPPILPVHWLCSCLKLAHMPRHIPYNGLVTALGLVPLL